MTTPRIEKAALEDLDKLQSLEQECFTTEAFSREHLTILLQTPNAINLTAKTDNKIVGFISGLVEKHGKTVNGHVLTIDVAVKHRRTGIGLRLLEELEHFFLRKDVKTIYLEVRADNQAALKLYRKKGYIDPQLLENYYSRGAHGFRMKKELKK